MIGLLCFALAVLASPFKSKLRLEAENAVLRHQLNVLRRRLHGRVRLTNHDRWFFIQLYRWFPSILKVLTIIQPETLVRWHRAGFRCYWRWKSRPRGGRPQIDTELRVLIRRMSVENPLWGAPRIHGEQPQHQGDRQGDEGPDSQLLLVLPAGPVPVPDGLHRRQRARQLFSAAHRRQSQRQRSPHRLSARRVTRVRIRAARPRARADCTG
jgi:hypothetical protein